MLSSYERRKRQDTDPEPRTGESSQPTQQKVSQLRSNSERTIKKNDPK
jgi:hypothetical protein